MLTPIHVLQSQTDHFLEEVNLLTSGNGQLLNKMYDDVLVQLLGAL